MKKSIGAQIAQLHPDQRELVPQINVEIEPKFELTVPPTDLTPIADAIKQLMLLPQPEPKVNFDVHTHEREHKLKRIKIEVTERDIRGDIKTLMCTELVDK